MSDATTLLGGLGYGLTKKIWLFALKSYFIDKKLSNEALIQIAHQLFEIFNDYSQVIEYGDKDLVSSLEWLDELIGDKNIDIESRTEEIIVKERLYFESNKSSIPQVLI